jgi:uncharacterized protein (TIGR02996 family)
VTTEDDFQRALDAHPEDWQTRLVFADWLDERGDSRAAGVRAMVAIGRHAVPCQRPPDQKGNPGPIQFIFGKPQVDTGRFKNPYLLGIIPADWFVRLKGHLPRTVIYWKHYHTRREADDAAAHAFARLSAKRQAKLLKRPA